MTDGRKRRGATTLSAGFHRRIFILLVCICFVFAGSLVAQSPEWTEPFPPHRIAGNLYYVGSKDLASYLIVTPQGDILINSSLESSPALIKKSVEELGFKFSDVKILLISHAHWDHDAGSAEVKKLTGAKYMVMDAEGKTFTMAIRRRTFTLLRRLTACCTMETRCGWEARFWWPI
jgi:hypothetical protein